jgi:hypothetical protein
MDSVDSSSPRCHTQNQKVNVRFKGGNDILAPACFFISIKHLRHWMPLLTSLTISVLWKDAEELEDQNSTTKVLSYATVRPSSLKREVNSDIIVLPFLVVLKRFLPQYIAIRFRPKSLVLESLIILRCLLPSIPYILIDSATQVF